MHDDLAHNLITYTTPWPSNCLMETRSSLDCISKASSTVRYLFYIHAPSWSSPTLRHPRTIFWHICDVFVLSFIKKKRWREDQIRYLTLCCLYSVCGVSRHHCVSCGEWYHSRSKCNVIGNNVPFLVLIDCTQNIRVAWTLSTLISCGDFLSQSILVRMHHTLSFVLLIQIFIDLSLLDCVGLQFPCRDHSIYLGIRILGFVNLSLFVAWFKFIAL